MKVGINGLGRIGGHVYRHLNSLDDYECVVVNDINPDIGNLTYMLNYDSTYSLRDSKFNHDSEYILGNNKKTKVLNCNRVSDIDFAKYEIDVWIDATGVTQNIIDARKCVDSGLIDKVISTFHTGHEDFTMILGVNEKEYNPLKHKILSGAICDAVAIAPVLKIIDDQFDIKNGYITTLHPWLNYQNLLDGPASSWADPGKIFHHYALGRAAVGNIIPKPTSVMEVIYDAITPLKQKNLKCFSYRMPTNIVCSADITINTKKNINNLNQIIDIFEDFIENQNFKIIRTNKDPLISSDFVMMDHSVCVDLRWLDVVDNNLLKIVLWYDNEYGYSKRIIDIINLIKKNIDL